MSDINKIKIGNKSPDCILRSGRIEEQDGNALWSWLKWANDAGGYFVRGLTILPKSPWGPYSWPWDLNIPNGALKDENAGFRYWGYIKDGENKNLSNGIKTNFPANINGNYDVCICVCNETVATKGIDLDKMPIVITFLDDRFDDAEWVINSGARVTIKGRTITIKKVPANDRGLVCTAVWADRTIENIRSKMTDIKANVTGLTYNRAVFDKPIDLSSVEIWKVAKGDEVIYNKDKTFTNCYEKYDYVTDTTISYFKEDGEGVDCTGYSVCNKNNLSQGVVVPLIQDLDTYLQNNTTLSDNFIQFNTPINNPKLEKYLRSWVKNNYINPNCVTTFIKGSNIGGELTFNINILDPSIPYSFNALPDFLEGTKVEKVNFNIVNPIYTIGSLHNMFRRATYLKEVTCNNSIRAYDCSGLFEFCGNLKSYPKNFIAWNNRLDERVFPESTNVAYCFEYSGIEHIPNCDEQDWIVCGSFSDQFLNGCSVKTIDPIIDVKYVNPNNGASLMFNCPTLESVKIEYLNHGDWSFDNQGNIINGNLPNLDKESIDYLFDNLTDLNTHIEGKDIVSEDTCFKDWGVANKHKVWFTSAEYTPTSTSYGPLIVYRRSTFNNIEFKVTFDDSLIDVVWDDGGTLTEIVNGVNTVSHVNEGTDCGFRARVKEGQTNSKEKVGIWFVNGCDPANPVASSANLYCPAQWEDKITDEMIAAANQKGWSIYIGRVLKESNV